MKIKQFLKTLLNDHRYEAFLLLIAILAFVDWYYLGDGTVSDLIGRWVALIALGSVIYLLTWLFVGLVTGSITFEIKVEIKEKPKTDPNTGWINHKED